MEADTGRGSKTETDRQKKKHSREKRGRNRENTSVSISLAPSRFCDCMLFTSQIAILKRLNSVAQDA